MRRTSPQGDPDASEHDAPSGGSGGGAGPEISARGGLRADRERRIAVVLAVAIVGLAAVAAGWRWFRWTRSDLYQLQRVDAEASALIRELDGTDSKYRWIAMMALVKGGPEARNLALEIRNPPYQAQALSLVAATLARAGAVEEAEASRRALLEVAWVVEGDALQIQDPLQKTLVLLSIASTLAEARLAEPSRAVARQAVAAAMPMDAAQRSFELVSIVKEFTRQGWFDASRGLALEIPDLGRRVVALTEIAEAMVKAKQMDPAREVAILAREFASKQADPVARGSSVRSAAECLARVGLADEAMEAALGLEDASGRYYALRDVALVFLERGRPELARDAAIRICQEVDAEPTPDGRWTMLRNVTEILAKAGSIDQAREAALEARRTMGQLKAISSQPTYYLGETAAMLARVGLADSADEIARSLRGIARDHPNPQVRVSAWIALIGLTTSSGPVNEIARSAQDAALRLSEPGLRSTMLNRLFSALGEKGLTAIGRDLASRLPDTRSKHDALALLVGAEIDAGSIDQARRMLRQIEELASRIDHPMDQSAAFSQIVKTWLRLEGTDEALRIAEMIPLPPTRSAALAAVSKALARKRRLREAREVAESCDLPSDRLEAFTAIVGESTKLSKPELSALIDELEAQSPIPGKLGF